MPALTLRRLQDLVDRRDVLDLQIAEAVADLRVSGLTWEAIGQALGVTKQAAQQRYG